MQGLELPLFLFALYAFVALRTLTRGVRHREELFDSELTGQDRQLLSSLAFYVLVPFSVALGLGVSLGLSRLWNAPVRDIHYGVYWARVLVEDEAVSPGQRALLAATPVVFSLAGAAGLVLWTFQQPIRAAHNFLRIEWARMLLGLSLLLHPLLSLFVEDGSVRELYRSLEAVQPFAGAVALAAYAAIAAAALWLWRSPRVRTRYLLLASALYDDVKAAQSQLADNALDSEARTDLAHSLFVAGDKKPARALLDRVLEHDPGHPRAGYLAGVAALEAGDPQRAAGYLRAAGQRLDEEDTSDAIALRFEVILALGAARLALGDNEGALLTIEAATERQPREPRALFLHAEALAAAGRLNAARARLERALGHAEGGLARAIRERLSRFP